MAERTTRTMESFQPNSHKSKAVKEKKVEKVVQGQVQPGKRRSDANLPKHSWEMILRMSKAIFCST